MIIDCDSCEVRGLACRDCVVTVLLGAPPAGVQLDEGERAAIDALADSGLVPPLRLVVPLDGSAAIGRAATGDDPRVCCGGRTTPAGDDVSDVRDVKNLPTTTAGSDDDSGRSVAAG